VRPDDVCVLLQVVMAAEDAFGVVQYYVLVCFAGSLRKCRDVTNWS
jgi:hypothetical protein